MSAHRHPFRTEGAPLRGLHSCELIDCFGKINSPGDRRDTDLCSLDDAQLRSHFHSLGLL